MGLRSYILAETVVLELSGEHDISTVPQIEPEISSLTDGRRRVIFDLGKCTYIDSTVLALLVKKHRMFGDGMRVVVPATSQLRRLFTITQLDQSFVVNETLAEALEA